MFMDIKILLLEVHVAHKLTIGNVYEFIQKR